MPTKYLLLLVLLFLAGLMLFFNRHRPSSISNLKLPPTPTITVELDADKLMALVNDWRVSQGYQPYIKNYDLCRVAKDRTNDGADKHKGFMQKIDSNFYGLPKGIVLQENYVSGPNEREALQWWLHSPPHLETLKKDYRYSCVACNKLQCNQVFSSF